MTTTTTDRTAIARDAAALAGFLTLTVGLSWAWPPAGPIVAGTLLLAAATIGHLRQRTTAPPAPTTDNDGRPTVHSAKPTHNTILADSHSERT